MKEINVSAVYEVSGGLPLLAIPVIVRVAVPLGVAAYAAYKAL